jgi:hypothetical protein
MTMSTDKIEYKHFGTEYDLIKGWNMTRFASGRCNDQNGNPQVHVQEVVLCWIHPNRRVICRLIDLPAYFTPHGGLRDPYTGACCDVRSVLCGQFHNVSLESWASIQYLYKNGEFHGYRLVTGSSAVAEWTHVPSPQQKG